MKLRAKLRKYTIEALKMLQRIYGDEKMGLCNGSSGKGASNVEQRPWEFMSDL